MRDDNIDLKIIFSDKRFKGVRIGLVGLLLAAVGFLVGVFVFRWIGFSLMVGGWAIAAWGFIAHLSDNVSRH